MNNSARLAKRWMRNTQARVVLGIAIGVILGWLSVRGMEWGLVVDQFQSFPLVWAIASVAIILLASLVRAHRWQVLFLRHRVSLARLFLVQNAGIGLNNLVPVRVVGEGAQFALLTLRYGLKGGVVLATLAMERILDLVVTTTLLMAGLTLLPGKGEFLPYVVGAFVVAIASALAIPFIIWVGRKPPLNRISLLGSTASFLGDLAREKPALAYAFSLTLAHWLLVGICAWVLAYGMELGISPFVATLAILGTLYFPTAVPAMPAAAGSFEFAIVYVLKPFGVSQALAFSYGLVIHAVLFLPPILFAIVVFSSVGLKASRNRDTLTQLAGARPVSIADQEGRP